MSLIWLRNSFKKKTIFKIFFSSFSSNMSWRRFCCRQREFSSRTVWVGRDSVQKFPPNVIRNQKYSVITFIPLVLYNQFKFFLNMFFLVMALSQFIPALRIGYLYTYWGPLGFVIAVTMIREAIDDFRRFQRDREVNGSKYVKLTPRGRIMVTSAQIKVGDIVYVEKVRIKDKLLSSTFMK